MDAANSKSPLTNSTVTYEAHNIYDTTDQDIYEDAKKACKGMDNNLNPSIDAAPTWTWMKALQAICVLFEYMQGIDSEYAHKCEMMLGTFGCETHTLWMQNMSDMKITSYFPPNLAAK